MTEKLKLETNPGALIGESPVWDANEHLLYWVDITGGLIFQYDPDSSHLDSFTIGYPVGAVVLRESGGLAMVTAKGYQFFDPKAGNIVEIADPEPELPENRFNDGKCDIMGRFWAGTMHFMAKETSGSLYRLDPDLKVTKKLENLRISNGLTWNLDNSIFYHIDSMTFSVTAYDFDQRTGELSGGRSAIQIAPEMGIPDGMTIDAEGKLWVAHYGGAAIRRWDPDTGKLLETVPIPVPYVTACAFGGDSLDTLFITTASDGLSQEQLANAPQSGALFSIKPGVKGTPPFRFKA